jgi:hypothetical protein
MKLIGHFADFLRDTVNLNQTRIDDLEASVEAIKTFVKDSDWEPRVWKFVEQGSWAHGTIIRPVDGNEFDADLLVIVEPVEGWSAADYVTSLGEAFAASGVYKDKVQVHDYCITITYAKDRRIDVAPCLRGREVEARLEVCNRSEDEFERTEPVAYTQWFNTRNGYSGSNSFRKVTRLIKHLRDIRGDFACPSVLLTTLIGERISWSDQGSDAFKDVPTTLKTIVGRLDDWLQLREAKPVVLNPELPGEDFAADFSDAEWADLRVAVHELREKVDAAYAESGRYDSILAWREVFGDRFAKGVTVLSKAAFEAIDEEDDETELVDVLREDASHDNRVVDLLARLGRWVWKPSLDRPRHMRPPTWPRADVVTDRVQVHATWRPHRHSAEGRVVRDFETLSATGGLWFDVTVNDGSPLPAGHFVRYRITNTGAVAMSLKAGRGGFESPQEGSRRWESLEYSGVHLTEAFIVRSSDGRLVGQSAPFHVVIR